MIGVWTVLLWCRSPKLVSPMRCHVSAKNISVSSGQWHIYKLESCFEEFQTKLCIQSAEVDCFWIQKGEIKSHNNKIDEAVYVSLHSNDFGNCLSISSSHIYAQIVKQIGFFNFDMATNLGEEKNYWFKADTPSLKTAFSSVIHTFSHRHTHTQN